MKKLVLINVDFKDAYTGKIHRAGDKVEMTDERITEVKSVNPEFVSVIGIVEEVATPDEAEEIEEVVEETAPKAKPDKKSK